MIHRRSNKHIANHRPRVGILSVPWSGVPPKRIGSVAKVVHETSRLLADQFTLTIIASPRNRDATQEVEGIAYRSVDDRWDRLLTHRWASVMERLRGWNRHPLHRDIYRPLYARRAVSIFRDAGCEAVVVHQCPQWLPILRRGLPGVKLLFWGHAATYVEEAGQLRDQLALADGVIGCSQYIVHRMEEQVPSLRGRAFTVYNGFDPERFFPDVSVERKKARLLYTGRVIAGKGVHVLVDAFRLLAPRHEGLELVVTGPLLVSRLSLIPGTDPKHVEEIRSIPRDYKTELIRRAGEFAPRMQITGVVSHEALVQLYRTASVYVQPALWEEGFGIPIVEAMACGTPVVASRRGGIPELIEVGKTGFLVPSGEPQALADVLDHLLTDEELRRELGDRAARTAPERFCWTRSAELMAKVLDRYTTSASYP